MFAIALLALVVACTSDDDDDDDGGEASPASPSGEITVAALQFESWDPHVSALTQDASHYYKVWRGLYHFDAQQQPVPSVAADMPAVSEDGLTYTVALREGLTWSDGDPLDADDFVAAFQRTCNPDLAGAYQYIVANVSGCTEYYGAADASADEKAVLRDAVGVVALDAHTLEFTLNESQPTFTLILAMWPALPAPSHLLTSVDAAWPGPLENVYNGPFMPSEYVEGDHMALAPNPSWDGEPVKVATITMRYIDDAAVANTAYRAGELDVAPADRSAIPAIQGDEVLGDELVAYPSSSTSALMFNLNVDALQDSGVRLALSRAIDRDTLNAVVLGGSNVPTTSWMAPERSGAEDGAYDNVLGFDPEAARDHLAKAGYADGEGFPALTLLLRDSGSNKATGEFLQAQWKEHLGIDVQIEIVDGKTLGGRYVTGEFDMVVGGWTEDYPDPENWMLGLWQTGGSVNFTFTSVAALDELLGSAQYDPDDAHRRETYREAEQVLLSEAAGVAPLYHRGNYFLVKPHISGMVEHKMLSDTMAGGAPGDWHPEYWSTSKV